MNIYIATSLTYNTLQSSQFSCHWQLLKAQFNSMIIYIALPYRKSITGGRPNHFFQPVP